MAQDPLRTLATEGALDGANLLLRALMDDLPDQVYLKDTEGRYLFNNAEHLKVLGAASPEGAAGKSDFDFYPKNLAEHYRADEEEVTRSGRPLICNEEPSVDGEGNERWHLTMKVPLRCAGGEIVGIVGITRDVTDRKEAEEALKESEARFRQLFERSTDALFVHDEHGRTMDCNAEACRSLGYTRDELLKLSVESFSAGAPTEEGTGTRKDDTPWKRAMASEPGTVVGYHETEHRRKDGTTFPVQVGIGAIDYGGQRLIFASARDLTERKEAEEKLRESEERFRAVLEDAPIGVALVGLDSRRFRVNHALCEMLGCSQEDLLGKDYLEHVHPDDREISAEHRRRALEEGLQSYTLERRYLHADGHVVWNLTNVSLIRDAKGNPSHLVCLHQDITERKEMETKLRKSEARLAEAQRIAHLGSWEWGVKSGEVSWSDETFRIYGYEPKEFQPTLGKLMEVVHPDDRELVRKSIDAALYGGELYDFEHRIVRPDGEERVVHRQAELFFDEEDGEPCRMVGTVHDITSASGPRRRSGRARSATGRSWSRARKLSGCSTRAPNGFWIRTGPSRRCWGIPPKSCKR